MTAGSIYLHYLGGEGACMYVCILGATPLFSHTILFLPNFLAHVPKFVLCTVCLLLCFPDYKLNSLIKTLTTKIKQNKVKD